MLCILHKWCVWTKSSPENVSRPNRSDTGPEWSSTSTWTATFSIDYWHDMITQKCFKKSKDPKHPHIACCHLLKRTIVKWFYGPPIRTNFHLPKLLVVKNFTHIAYLKTLYTVSIIFGVFIILRSLSDYISTWVTDYLVMFCSKSNPNAKPNPTRGSVTRCGAKTEESP